MVCKQAETNPRQQHPAPGVLHLCIYAVSPEACDFRDPPRDFNQTGSTAGAEKLNLKSEKFIWPMLAVLG